MKFIKFYKKLIQLILSINVTILGLKKGISRTKDLVDFRLMFLKGGIPLKDDREISMLD